MGRMSSNAGARAFLASIFISSFLCSRAEATGLTLSWNRSGSPSAAGYMVHYGPKSHDYTVELNVGTNLSATMDGLDPGVTYYFAVSAYDVNGFPSGDSDEVSGAIPILPVIKYESPSQTAQAGTTVTLFIDVIGTPPVTFQWYNGTAPVGGGTEPILNLADVSDADAGNYTVVVNDLAGSVTSSVATVTIIDPTSKLNPTASALGALVRPDGGASGDGPGAAGTLASAGGTYNGLFYQTNDDGWPAIDVQTAGLLTNCVVDAQGNFTGAIYLDGLSNFISGAFDTAGDASNVVDRAAAGLSELGVALHLDGSLGMLEMTGIVSNLDQGDPWTALLTADPETNVFDQSTSFGLVIPPINGMPGGTITGVEGNGVMSLSGALGDGTTFSQSAPVSIDGSMPLFVQLYGHLGLLMGWVNVFGSPSTAVLTWIDASGQTGAGFTNVLEATVIPADATGP